MEFSKPYCDLKIGCWNIQGLSEIKRQDESITKFINDHDCAVFTETWLQDSISFENVYTYCLLAKRSKYGRGKCGITITMKKSIRQGVKVLNISSSYIVLLKFDKLYFKLPKDFYLCAVYIPPQYSSKTDTSYIDIWCDLEEIVSKYKDDNYIAIIGDLNSRIGNWNESLEYSKEIDINSDLYIEAHKADSINHRNSRDSVKNKFGRKLIELCCHNNLVILNGRTLGDLQGQYTSFQYNGCSVVDYSIVDSDLYDYVKYFHVHTTSHLSDHAAIAMFLNVKCKKIHNLSSTYRELPKAFKWDGDSYMKVLQTPKFIMKVSDICNKNYSTNVHGVDTLCADISTLLVDAAKYSLKRCKSYHKGARASKRNKWYTKDLRKLKQEVISTCKVMQKYPNDPIVRGRYSKNKKLYKKACKSSKNSYMKSVAIKLETAIGDSPSNFWNLVKGLKESADVSSELPNMDDLVNHFSKVYEKPPTAHDQTDPLFERSVQSFIQEKSEVNRDIIDSLDRPVTKEELLKVVKNLKSKKSFGEDQINNRMIKASIALLDNSMLKLFNMSIDCGEFPAAWCQGYIVPILKSGDKSDASNYRPITISSCLGKIFSSILNNRVMQFLETNNIISKAQIGFRKGHQTSDHLLLIKALINAYKQKRKHIYASFVDFSVAFDSVWHLGMIYKLYKSGFTCKIVRLLQSMYSKIKACVRRGNYLSENFSCNRGTRQGCNLSPGLFNGYTNDLYEIFNSTDSNPVKICNQSIGCLMYADDIVILSESASGLQKSLNKLQKYCKKWKLNVNAKKTKAMVFNSNSTLYTFKIGENILQCVNQVCYLGFLLTPSGSFKATETFLYNKACRALASLRNVLNKVPELSVKVKMKMFDTLISPILMYGSEVWGAYMFKYQNDVTGLQNMLKNLNCKMEKLHTKFCKFILQLPRKSCNYGVRYELGRYPLFISVILRSVKYFLNVLNRSPQSLVHIAVRLHMFNNKSWYSFIKYVVETLNYNINTICKADIKSRKDSMCFKLRQLSQTVYFNELKLLSRMQLLLSVKHNWGCETYLNSVKDSYLRKCISQIRLSCHRFPIEIGRQSGVSRQNRLCNMCLMAVGTERHMLLECYNPKLSIPRNDFISAINKINSNISQLSRFNLFNYLMMFKDNTFVSATAKYIKEIMYIHSQTV